MKQTLRIGDLLVDNGLITENMLQAALAAQKKSRLKLGKQLIELDYITEDQLLGFLAQQLKIPQIDLRRFQYNSEVVSLIPEQTARRFRTIALNIHEANQSVLVGMADPTDIFAYDELARILQPRALELAIVRESDLVNALDTVYRSGGSAVLDSLAEELNQELSATDFNLEDLLSSSDVGEAPVVRLLQNIFDDAVHVRASDIHIEPDETSLRIRMRIDGQLQEQVMKEKRIATALVSRLKLMSGLDISEKRLPQDGRFNIRVRERSIDVRVSTMPLTSGEAVVMRLLDQSGGTLELKKIGMPPDIMARFARHIHKPHGLVLVTGPTGSGKTTTLYGALNELNIPSRKIITVEDPVEYRLQRVNQVQVNAQIGLTFATVLRTALRQDPDVVLIGEMRDQETAEIGLRAAITGHLVLSTLHTNDSVSTAIRLIDMGIPGFMVATSLEAIIAQRLVRRICDNCAAVHEPSIHERGWLLATLGSEERVRGLTFRSGRGCHLCNNTGYKGRIGVFELLEMNDEMVEALRIGDTNAFARAAMNDPDFVTLSMNALEYAKQGITSLEEVIRISGDDSLTQLRRQQQKQQQEQAATLVVAQPPVPEPEPEPDPFPTGGLSLVPWDYEGLVGG